MGIDARERSQTGASAILLPADTLLANNVKYSESTSISAGTVTAAILTVGAANAEAHSAETTHICESILKDVEIERSRSIGYIMRIKKGTKSRSKKHTEKHKPRSR